MDIQHMSRTGQEFSIDDGSARLNPLQAIDEPLNFPAKIYQILESESPDVICWNENGLSFRIVDAKRFEQEILPKYFRHQQFSSVQRQLNLYKFRSISRGEHKRSFYHPIFKRGNWHAVREMTRDALPRKQQQIQLMQMQQQSFGVDLRGFHAVPNQLSNQQVFFFNPTHSTYSSDGTSLNTIPIQFAPNCAPITYLLPQQPQQQQQRLPGIHLAPSFFAAPADMCLLNNLRNKLNPVPQAVLPSYFANGQFQNVGRASLNTTTVAGPPSSCTSSCAPSHAAVTDNNNCAQCDSQRVLCSGGASNCNDSMTSPRYSSACLGVVKIRTTSFDMHEQDNHYCTDFLSKESLTTVDPVDHSIIRLLDSVTATATTITTTATSAVATIAASTPTTVTATTMTTTAATVGDKRCRSDSESVLMLQSEKQEVKAPRKQQDGLQSCCCSPCWSLPSDQNLLFNDIFQFDFDDETLQLCAEL